MDLADELGAKFYELVSTRTGPCTNHGTDPCAECMSGGVEAAKEWLARHSCATCRWGVPAAPEPDGYTMICEGVERSDIVPAAAIGAQYCDNAWLRVSPTFGCVMWEAKP